MQIVLTPSQLHLVASLSNGSIPLLPNPFRGWLASEIEHSMVQAGVLLVSEQLAVNENNQILISDILLRLIHPAIHSRHVVVLQVASNLDMHLFYGFYRSLDTGNGVFIARVGINAYAIEEKSTHQVIHELMQYVGITQQGIATSLAPFQISRQNVERIIRRNPDAQQAVRVYDFSMIVDGNQHQAHRVVFIRNQWWYATLLGEDYRFDPIDGNGLFHLIEQCIGNEQRA